MKKVFAIFLFVVCVSSVFGQSIRTDFDLAGFGVKISTDPRLVVVRTTLELAGIQTELSEEGKAFRKRVLSDFKDFNPSLKEKFKIFVFQYKRRHPNATEEEIESVLEDHFTR